MTIRGDQLSLCAMATLCWIGSRENANPKQPRKTCMSDSQWTDERIEKLKQLYLAGVRLEDIRVELGGGLSRSAISGKANRLGLVHGKSPLAKRPKLSRARPRQKLSRLILGGLDFTNQVPKVSAPVVVSVAPVAPVEPTPLRLDLFQLTDSVCKWSVSDEPPHFFCGHPTEWQQPWCQWHRRIAWTTKRTVA